MKTITLILCVFLTGCTYIRYNTETKDFVYISTKECEACEAFYKHGEITIKIGKVSAFEGQKAVTGIIKDIIKPSLF